jgi:hypothetical protein
MLILNPERLIQLLLKVPVTDVLPEVAPRLPVTAAPKEGGWKLF